MPVKKYSTELEYTLKATELPNEAQQQVRQAVILALTRKAPTTTI